MIYLDNAASAPLPQSVKNELLSLLDEYGNPSSLHAKGQSAKRILCSARKSAADFLNCDPGNIYFTPGGAAANTLGIRGYAARHDCHIFYSPTAHKSVLNCVHTLPQSTPLKVSQTGRIVLSGLKEALKNSCRTPFVVIDYANSEIGTIQNVQKILETVHACNGVVYLDCTGSIPTIPVDLKQLDADMLGFSAHKLGGLKGCGVFYKKPDIELEPLIYGSQERGLIGGTENIFGTASLNCALKQHDYSLVSPANRDYVYRYILRHIPESYLVGSFKNRLAHNLYICFKGVDGEALTLLLDADGIAVSTGSACNSQSLEPSAVLSAIGMDENDMHSCIRMTFCGQEPKEELDYVCHRLKINVERLRSFHATGLCSPFCDITKQEGG